MDNYLLSASRKRRNLYKIVSMSYKMKQLISESLLLRVTNTNYLSTNVAFSVLSPKQNFISII